MSKKQSGSRNGESKPEEIATGEGELSHDEVSRVAYALWEARGRGDGSAEQDWFEAERQLREPKAQTEAA